MALEIRPTKPRRIKVQITRQIVRSPAAVQDAIRAFLDEACDGWLCTPGAVQRMRGTAAARALHEAIPLNGEFASGDTSLSVQHLGPEAWQLVTTREGYNPPDSIECWALDHTYVAIDPALGKSEGADQRAREVCYRIYWPVRATIDDTCRQPGAHAVRFIQFIDQVTEER